MKNIIVSVALLLVTLTSALSQERSTSVFKAEDLNWYNKDHKDNKIMGASVDKTYKELLTDKKPKKTVIVAVIDGGVDINHEDLKGKIWINEKEIAGNNIDDDKNGYVDDLYGWNFIGNSKGENVDFENFEYTRIVEMGPGTKDYELAKKLFDDELIRRTKDKENLEKFTEKYKATLLTIKDKTGVEVKELKDLDAVTSTDDSVVEAVAYMKSKYEQGFTEQSLESKKKRNADYLDKYLNINYDARELVGDNVSDINDTHYGNPDVIGPRADHGSSSAGIIAGIRNNGMGVDGIATEVKIMALRTTPNGDERDKDVALAIRYAVDNGADIINMSFGKAVSPQQSFVEDAVKYAEGKNVLLIHAAGNEGMNIDLFDHYPSDRYLDKTEASNYMNVGASGKENDENIAGKFSNYGKKHVDLFAPGINIISTDTGNYYSMHNGTSSAAPVVSGVAALILSYYPELTPKELINILLESSTDLKKEEVLKPDLKNKERVTVKFGELCVSGGIVNAYEAMKRAESYSKSRK